MKFSIKRVPGFFLGSVYLLVSTYAAFSETKPPANRPTVAVVGILSKDSGSEAEALSGLLESLLVERGFPIVDRQTLEKTLGEQALGVGGLTESAAVASTGKLTGARILLSGRWLPVGKERFLTLRLVRTDTAEILPASLTFPSDTSLMEVATSAANKVVALTSKISEPDVSVNDGPILPSELVEKYRGRTLPMVRVKIPEIHLTRAVPDPAVMTEMIRALKEVGFPITDGGEKSPAPAILVGGEAFSEFGMQAGQLISCRARVELKVVDVASGEIFYVEDAHASAVDVAENLAGKAALKKAARSLAVPLVTALLKRVP